MAGNPLYGIMWIIVLAVAWPVAGLLAGIWIAIQPFEACFSCAKDCSDFFEGFVTWPRSCGKAINNCSTSCPKP